jgi:hypothetical protein
MRQRSACRPSTPRSDRPIDPAREKPFRHLAGWESSSHEKQSNLVAHAELGAVALKHRTINGSSVFRRRTRSRGISTRPAAARGTDPRNRLRRRRTPGHRHRRLHQPPLPALPAPDPRRHARPVPIRTPRRANARHAHRERMARRTRIPSRPRTSDARRGERLRMRTDPHTRQPNPARRSHVDGHCQHVWEPLSSGYHVVGV